MGLLKPIIRIGIESGISRVWTWIRIKENQEKREEFHVLKGFGWTLILEHKSISSRRKQHLKKKN
jgi:hypothetical protein